LKNGGSWGGPLCHSTISLQTHIIESTGWLIIWIFLYFLFDSTTKIKELVKRIDAALEATPSTTASRRMETALGCVNLVLYLQIIYYKSSIHSLINLLQPCHVLLLLQCVSLFNNGQAPIKIKK
jgi:hypothetical protein